MLSNINNKFVKWFGLEETNKDKLIKIINNLNEDEVNEYIDVLEKHLNKKIIDNKNEQ